MLSGLGDIGLNVLFWLLIILVSPMLFDSFSLDIFGYCVVVVWFSLWFLIFSNLHMVHPEGTELDAALSITCKNDSFTNTTTVVHCDKLSFRQHEVMITNRSQQKSEHVANNDMYKLVFR